MFSNLYNSIFVLFTISLTALFPPTSSANSITEQSILYWDPDKKIIKTQLQFKNNLLHGEQNFFSPYGSLLSKMSFNSGIPNGIQTTGNSSIHYQNGVPKSITTDSNLVPVHHPIDFMKYIQSQHTRPQSHLLSVNSNPIPDKHLANSVKYLPDYYSCHSIAYSDPYCMHVNLSSKSLVNISLYKQKQPHQIHHTYHPDTGTLESTFTQDIHPTSGYFTLNVFRNIIASLKAWWFSIGRDVHEKYTTKYAMKHGLHEVYSRNGSLTQISSYYYNKPEATLEYYSEKPTRFTFHNNGIPNPGTVKPQSLITGLEKYILSGGAASTDSYNEITGTGIKYSWHNNGSIKSKVRYNNFLYQGITESWFPSGSMSSSTLYPPTPLALFTNPPFYNPIKPIFTYRYLYNEDGSTNAIMEN